MKANEILGEADPTTPKDPMWYKLHKATQAVGDKVADKAADSVAVSLAKKAGQGIMQGLSQVQGGSDPMGLGGFQHREPAAAGATKTTTPKVSLMDPQTKKPVTYTLQGKYWFDASGRAVSDENIVGVLNSEYQKQQKA